MRALLRILVVACLVALAGTARRAPAADDPAGAYLTAAMNAVGGEAKLAGIVSLDYTAVGTRQMVEQSERPTGPYFIDHFRVRELRDLAGRRTRIERTDEGYGADRWWLQQTGPDTSTTVIDDDVAATFADDKFGCGGGSLIQENEEQWAFAPERLLLTARAATDLHAEPDESPHGVPHHVLAFTWNGAPCRLLLDAATSMPWSIEWTRPYPDQTFLNAWGDVTTTLTYNGWTLEPDGVSYPREWSFERLGLPDQTLSITQLHLNPRFDTTMLTVPAEIYAAHHGHVRKVSEVPLGYGAPKPPHELAPGILEYPGGWNVAFVKQPDGIVVIEAPWSPAYTQRALDAAVARYGGPVKAVITTSDSWPHIAGVRQAVADGIPVYALDLNLPILQRLVDAPHRAVPDLLALQPRMPNFIGVARNTAIGTGPNRLEIVPYRTATGERQMMVYFPEHRLLYTSDLFSEDGNGGWFTPQFLHEMTTAVGREHLDVESIFGMHYDLTPYADVVSYLARIESGSAP